MKTTRRDPEYQAYQILRAGYTVLPLAVGTDKFFHVLTNWDQYLAPIIPRLLGLNSGTFMMLSAGAEIVVGIGVAIRPRIFAYVAFLWLVGIVANLVLTGRYYDIVLRDVGLAVGALALARLSARFN